MSKEECYTCSDRLKYVKLCEKYDQLESVHKVLVEDNLTYENQIADLEAKLAESEKNVELYKKEKCLARPDSKPFVRLEDYQRLEQQLAEKELKAKETLNQIFKDNREAKISFAVEQLEKVKELLFEKAIEITGTSVDTVRLYSINEIFDNQINVLRNNKDGIH